MSARSNARQLRDRAATSTQAKKEKTADAVCNSIQNNDSADIFESGEIDEVHDSAFQGEDLVPVYEDFCDERDNFSYEYISSVLAYVDAHPTHKFATIKTKFRRVKHPNYLRRFREYHVRMGTWRDRLIQVAQHTKECYDLARANSLVVHDDDIREWALQEARELSLTKFTASPQWVQNFKRVHIS